MKVLGKCIVTVLACIAISVGLPNDTDETPIAVEVPKEENSLFDVSGMEELLKNAQNVGILRKTNKNEVTRCECAVFNTTEPLEDDLPFFTQAPITMSCDSSEEERCGQLCIALAKAAKERGPQLLCATVGHADQLKGSLFSRICGAEKWTFSGLTSPDAICCHNSLVMDCKEMHNLLSTQQIL